MYRMAFKPVSFFIHNNELTVLIKLSVELHISIKNEKKTLIIRCSEHKY